MYKLLLCWRYLLTRYIALASVISVMLGVATMIVVNAVMLGFTSEMKDRINGILADVIFQTYDLNKGFPGYEYHRELILEIAGDLIEELTPTVVVPGMLFYQIDGVPASFQVDIVGIDVLTQGKVSKIAEYLQHPENRRNLSFDLRDGGYDVQGSGDRAPIRRDMGYAGWGYRSWRAAQLKYQQRELQDQQQASAPAAEDTEQAYNPFDSSPPLESMLFDMAKEQHAGIIAGIGVSLRYRDPDAVDPETGKRIVEDHLALLPGDDIMLAFPTVEVSSLKLQSDKFTVVDLYESKMADYDRKLVFVPIEKLQYLRGMVDADSGQYTITQILIKAKPGVDINELRDRLRSFFPPQLFSIKTWQDEQVDLLNAIRIELGMLNVLLLLIFAVAGFGILAIFYMIVVEKQKDIGILKALGASSGGVMQIFLYYSLLLGTIGSALGLGVGLLFVKYIKEIAWMLSYVLQTEIFSPEIYSFYEIPAVVDFWTVFFIILGAVLIAVMSGVFPALRAARVHPVETLRS